MASYETALVREYLLSWLEQLAGDVAFTEPARSSMRRDGLDLGDVIAALESSDTAKVAKENSHDAFFSLVGTTCDDDTLRIVVTLDPLGSGLCVHEVNRL